MSQLKTMLAFLALSSSIVMEFSECLVSRTVLWPDFQASNIKEEKVIFKDDDDDDPPTNRRIPKLSKTSRRSYESLPTFSKTYPARPAWQTLQKSRNKDGLPVYKEVVPKPYTTHDKEYLPRFKTSYSGKKRSGKSVNALRTSSSSVIGTAGTKHIYYSPVNSPVHQVELKCRIGIPNQPVKWFKYDGTGDTKERMIANGDRIVFKDDHYGLRVNADHSTLIIYEPNKSISGHYSCTNKGYDEPIKTFNVYT